MTARMPHLGIGICGPIVTASRQRALQGLGGLVYTPATPMPRRPGDAGRREFLKRSMLAAAALPGVAAPISGEQAAARQPASASGNASAGRGRVRRRGVGRACHLSARVHGRPPRADCISPRRDWHRLHRPRGTRPAARLGDLQSPRQGQRSELRVRRDSRRTPWPCRVLERPRVAPRAAVSRDVRPGFPQRARPAAPAGGDVHRRVPACARRLPGSPPSGAGLARRVQPVHPARGRRFGPAGCRASLSRDELVGGGDARLDRLVHREPAAGPFRAPLRDGSTRQRAATLGRARRRPDAQPASVARPSVRGEHRPLGARRRQRSGHHAARVAPGTMVDERGALLGRLHRRRRARARIRRSGSRRVDLPRT